MPFAGPASCARAKAPWTCRPGAALPLGTRYAATVLQAERVRFRWLEVGSSREAIFPILPSGSRQFRVASRLDGVNFEPRAPLHGA